MTFYRGRAQNGQDKYTLVMDWWSAMIIGIIIGFYIGNLWGHADQIKIFMEEAPNYMQGYLSSQ